MLRDRRVRRSGAALLMIIALSAGVLTACQPAKVGAKCRSGFARDSRYVLICKKGKWARWMTIVDYLNLVKALKEKNPTPPSPNPPSPNPPSPNPPPPPPTPVPVAWSLVSHGAGDGIGYASALIGNTAFIGGAFSSVTDGVNVRSRGGLAAFDATTGALKEGFVANTNGIVKALATDGSYLYVGGTFTVINGQPRGYLAKLDPNTGAVVPWAQDASDKVYALDVSDDKLYVGGIFDVIGGQNRRRAAAIDLTSGAVDATFKPTIGGGSVDAIDAAPDDSSVYVSGSFTTINGNPHTLMARLNTSGNTVLVSGSEWDGLISPPLDLEVAANGEVLAAIGGPGDLVGDNRVARYKSNGDLVWAQDCGTSSGDAQAVHEVNGVDYAGFHQGCNGDPSFQMLKLNGITGGIDGSFKPSVAGYWGPYSISGDSTAIIFAGDFPSVNGNARRGFIIYRPAP